MKSATQAHDPTPSLTPCYTVQAASPNPSPFVCSAKTAPSKVEFRRPSILGVAWPVDQGENEDSAADNRSKAVPEDISVSSVTIPTFSAIPGAVDEETDRNLTFEREMQSFGEVVSPLK